MRESVDMRELDTASPVIWPSWCYSGESQELERGVSIAKKKSTTSPSAMTTVEGGVKSERLSPSSSGGCAGGDTGSSRSGTPSSSCTPPRQGGSPSQHPQLPARNYSDFMRSLAAKYNNNNPTDYLQPRNGFTGLKSGTPPFPGLLPPPAAATATTGPKSDEKTSPENQAMLGFVPFPPVFSPVIDMNATQALLNMVRTHQQGAVHLENYLKGVSSKRENLNTPLDLSSKTPPPKKHKRTLSESLYGTDVLPLLRGTGGIPAKRPSPASTVPSASTGTTTMPTIGSRRPNKSSASSPASTVSAPCGSVCALKPCMPDTQTVGHWTVEDVAGFVASVDMCAEYAHNFREQRIDGSALPLLTEEHLTSTLGMKLGPALKLRSALSNRLGQCVVCLHCSHCHGNSAQLTTTTSTTTTTIPSNSATTPNSTGTDK